MMDVLIDESGGGIVPFEESGSGKKRRMMKVRSVVDWVERVPLDVDSQEASLLLDTDYVICLSNTERQLGDPAVENRNCIATTEVEGKGASGRLSTLEEFTSAVTLELSFLREGLSKPLVCSEAFKLLEKDFSGVLKSLCNMKEYADVVEDVKGVVSAAAKRQNWPIAKSGWVETVSFGVFAEAVLMLNTTDIEGMTVGRQHKKMLNNLKAQITEIFWTALEEGISMLEEEDAYTEVQDPKIDDAIAFLRNRENLMASLNEWTASCRLRIQRNSISHPFSSAATHDVRVAALKYYDTILGSDFSEDFRHVGELGRLKLKTIVTSGAKKAMKSLENKDTMEALLSLCELNSGNEGADSSDNSD